jgi:hypothetical protein
MKRKSSELIGRGRIVSRLLGLDTNDADTNAAFMEQRDLVSFRRACSGRNGNPTVFVDDFEPLQVGR